MPRPRIDLRIIDSHGRTVTTTSVATYKDHAQQERACQSMLEQIKKRWTHYDQHDRAQWGYQAHDHTGHLISHG